MKIKTKDNSSYFVILVLYILLYFYKLGSIGLIDVDEPRYAEAGREILESRNWIVPYFNYHVRFDKPILFYFLEAVSMKLFGVNEFAARLPSALGAFLCISTLFILLREIFGLTSALLGSLVLISSFEFVSLSRFSITDMTLACFISSSIICFFLGYNNIVNSHRFFKLQIGEISMWYIFGFIFLALAVLTKGPVALLIVGLVLLPFFWWVEKLDYFFKNNSFWLGLFLFLIIVFPWYIAAHFATGGEFTKTFFGLHNFNRFTSVVSGHKGSLFYFIPVIMIGFLPWTFFLLQAINSIIKKGLKVLLNSPKEQLPWFCLWWFFVIFIFFSISQTKLLTYILPVFPALSVIVSVWLEEVMNKHLSNKGLVIGLGFFFLFCLIIFYLCVFHLDILMPREIKSLKLGVQIMFFAFLLLVGVSMAWASSHKDERMTVFILLSTFLVFYFCIVTFLLPKIDMHSQYHLRTFAKSIPQDVEIATYQIIKPSLTFYAKREIKKIDFIGKLQNRINQKTKFAFVTKKKLLEHIPLENLYKWGEDDRYVFYTNYPPNK